MPIPLISFLLALLQVFHTGDIPAAMLHKHHHIPAQSNKVRHVHLLRSVDCLADLEDTDTNEKKERYQGLSLLPLRYGTSSTAVFTTIAPAYCAYTPRSGLADKPLFLLHRNFRI